MSEKLEAIEADALSLSEEERVQLAERLLASLTREDGIDEAWSAEIKRRVLLSESGEMRYSAAADVIGRARKALG